VLADLIVVYCPSTICSVFCPAFIATLSRIVGWFYFIRTRKESPLSVSLS
jgi:hypothetical protein